MKQLSKASGMIQPSLTRKLFNLAKEYDNVVDFTLGDPDIPTPLPIREAGCRAIMEGRTRYSQNAGLLELRERICRHYADAEDLHYDPGSEIIVTVGAMEGLYLALLSMLNEGDEVIIPAPCYVNYKQMVLINRAIPVIVNGSEADALGFSYEAIAAAVTDKTKAIILNTPCNPTGRIASQDIIRKIAALAVREDLYVIADEVYKCLIYDNADVRSIASLPGMKERTVLVNSLSKEFCMTGWRVGYVFAPPEIVSVMVKLQENVAACAPLPSQHAAMEAFAPGKEYSREMVGIFKNRRDVLVNEMEKATRLRCPAPPSTFYAMVDIGATGMNSEDFAYALLKEAQVAVVPGIAYGDMCDNYVRLAFTISEERIREGVRRMIRFADGLG